MRHIDSEENVDVPGTERAPARLDEKKPAEEDRGRLPRSLEARGGNSRRRRREECEARAIPPHEAEQRWVVALDLLVELEPFEARLSLPSRAASQHLAPALHDAARARVIAIPTRLARRNELLVKNRHDQGTELTSRTGEPELRDDHFRDELLGAEREE